MSFTAPVMYTQEEEETRKGPWTVEEDRLLINYVALHGEGRWNILAKAAGLKRCGKSCRLRWVNYLRPDLKRGNITPDEERLIIDLQSRWGNRWSRIAQRLPGRTDNEIKNYWRTRLKRKLHKTNAGNRYSSPYLFHYNSMQPHSFLQQNSRSAEENTAAVQNILQQSGTLCNNPVVHFDEEEKERFVICPFDSIRILNGVNNLEENNGVVEDLSMSYEMESFAAMVSELYEDVLEDGGRSQFMEY